MKNVKMLIAASLMLGMLACEKENETLEGEFNSNLELTNSMEGLTNDSATSQNRSSGALEIELNSAWAGFVLAKMLRYDENSARSIVLNELGPMGTTIPLEDILGSSGNASFINGFRTHIAYYIEHAWPDPDGEKDKPGFPLGQNPPNPSTNSGLNSFDQRGLDNGNDPDPNSPAVQEVMDILLDENCLEFHFPNGVNFSGQFNLISVSHPMNNDTINQGMRRHYNQTNNTVGTIGPNTEGTFTEFIDVHPTLVYNSDNVIIVRPYRTTDIECSYDNFSHISDFTDFLR